MSKPNKEHISFGIDGENGFSLTDKKTEMLLKFNLPVTNVIDKYEDHPNAITR
jgi:hypothetical protein